MITTTTMKTQVGRLMRLPYIPREPEDIKALAEEYKRVITDRCRDDAHLVRTIDSLMDTPREQLLTPGDIVAAATGTAVDDNPIGWPGCDACGFTGWISREKGGYSFSSPCPSCRGPKRPPSKRPPSMFELDRRKRQVHDGRAAAAGDRE